MRWQDYRNIKKYMVYFMFCGYIFVIMRPEVNFVCGGAVMIHMVLNSDKMLRKVS